jgi:hypothetical protein
VIRKRGAQDAGDDRQRFAIPRDQYQRQEVSAIADFGDGDGRE